MVLRLGLLIYILAFFPHRADAKDGALYSDHSSRAVSSGAKAGLAWPNGSYIGMQQFETTGKVQWYYTWSPNSVQGSGIEFVPMLWGNTQVSDWQSTINSTISSQHVTHALGFNEPEQSSQSNLSPSDGAALWQEHMEPLKAQNVTLCSPAPSSAPSGKQWLLDWLNACDGGCTVDIIALHWYDINSTTFMEYLEDFHNTFQKNLWVTEWACQNFNQANSQCSLQDIVNFMNATQDFMDNTPWVERYAWFGAMENLQGVNQEDALIDTSGTINTLGEQYIGAVAPNVSANYTPGVVHGGKGVPFQDSSESLLHSTSVPLLSVVLILVLVITLC
ncbi:hypothetical protein OBBRIDRAFT_724588 [Obba rivulosa]|uniref:Asl1-like glycosyl hydrolase catalytic domain-containing protein n=1 Tax=Obba rivulosa TaxID=1052685 RepID=A0A8E2DPT1_9APHY|nr:hypothetical protein OBBRIDRAFT_724588 [Obba rivulosa]